MGRLRFFQGFIVVLTVAFVSVGASLLAESISNPARPPWALLGGALLCSLALMFAYFLWKQRAGGNISKHGHPPSFLYVWQRKDLEEGLLYVWQGKELQDVARNL
jgi:hypothetical protein